MRELDLMVVRRADTQGQLMTLQLQPKLMEKIRVAQSGDVKLQQFRE